MPTARLGGVTDDRSGARLSAVPAWSRKVAGFELWVVAAAVLSVVVLAVFANLIGSSAWLWTGLLGTGLLVAFGRLGTRAFLIAGAFLVGSGVGILFEATFGWEGAYLMSVGAGLVTAEGIDTKPGRYVLLVGGLLASLGLVLAVAAAGTASLVGLSLVAAAVGAVAATRR